MMRIRIASLLVATAAWAALAAGGWAQDAGGHDEEAMQKAWQEAATPGAPHEFLARMAGTWKTVTTEYQGGEPGEASEGRAVFTVLLGGRVVQGKYTGTMGGQPFEGMSLDGYDNVTKEYWSTWVDSMGTGLYVSHGRMTGEKTCEHTGSMTTPMGEMPMRFVTTRESPNQATMKGYVTMPGADETLSMVVQYTRES